MENKYEIIMYWSNDDNAVIAEVPELAGCMADGNTYNEALQNVEVIIEEWIETARSLGKEIPMPKIISVPGNGKVDVMKTTYHDKVPGKIYLPPGAKMDKNVLDLANFLKNL